MSKKREFREMSGGMLWSSKHDTCSINLVLKMANFYILLPFIRGLSLSAIPTSDSDRVVGVYLYILRRQRES